MVMIIIHTAYIIRIVTNDALHAYDVIGVYKIHHGAGRISYFAEPAILWLAGTAMGEVGFHNRVGHDPLANRPIPLMRKNIVLINPLTHVKLILSWS